MATAQINARIDSDLKTSGDRALEMLGYSPTRIIRLLWGFVADNWHDTVAMQALFDLLENHKQDSNANCDAEARAQRAEEGPRIVANALSEMGVSQRTLSALADTPYDDLLEQAYIEKLDERGLLA